jgi:hypothetical protein
VAVERRVARTCGALALVAAACTSCAPSARSHAAPSATPSTRGHVGAPLPEGRPSTRYGSQSSAAALGGAAWQFREGLRVEVTAVTRLAARLGTGSRRDGGLALLRVDFTYTNHGAAVNLSDGRQLPVRLLYGRARDEAPADGGYEGTAGQLTVPAPARVEPGATVHGARSFDVPVGATDDLAVLVVEPRRYTEHLFTDIEVLLPPG